MPSVATSSRVAGPNRRSNRICQPISAPIVQPRSSAIRWAIARAATRRGWRRITGPSATSAGGTRVVLPAPGGAVTTTARDWRAASTISGTKGSIGSGGSDTDRTAYASSAVAAVAAGILGEILLVVVLGVVELWSGENLGRD